MAELFPQIEPYEFGFLEVDSIHKIYWEKTGNSEGVPILVLHGGPGAPCKTKMGTPSLFPVFSQYIL